MNKVKIIKEIIRKLHDEILELEKNYERVREVVITAPGAMQSASDTTRMTESEIAEKMQMAMSEKRETISFLEEEGGSLIQIQDGDKEHYFFLLPKEGGLKVEVDGYNITTLTPEAPLAQALTGKKTGDEIDVKIGEQEKKMRIVNIY